MSKLGPVGRVENEINGWPVAPDRDRDLDSVIPLRYAHILPDPKGPSLANWRIRGPEYSVAYDIDCDGARGSPRPDRTQADASAIARGGCSVRSDCLARRRAAGAKSLSPVQ